ncbi:MAG TPA: hypothetical protein VEH07_08715 [Alphaproteobacteria bacterium]|nr:hypothetical protein [Alphaproteobacteria bacterium]
MSSSSSPAVAREITKEPEGEGNQWLAQVLEALSREVAKLSNEITDVGDALSTRVFAKGEMKGVKEMQAFDALSQLARAQADILARISAQLGEPPDEMKAVLQASIANLPIFDVRQRMMQVIDPAASQGETETAEESPDSIQWFE